MNIIRFYNQISTILPDGENKFRKKALIAVEGTQEDCEGNKHELPKERLEKIVNNTNQHLKKFRMYLIKDHNFKSGDVLGVVKGQFKGKIITESDLPDDYAVNPNIYKDLVGKYGVFCDRLDLFETDFVDKINNGLNGISMGLAVDDNEDEKIIEISLTPAPAIPHMRLFNMNISNYRDVNISATSWNDIDRVDKKSLIFESEFEKLASQLYLLIENIKKNEANYIVSSVDVNQKLIEILNGFAYRVIKLYQSIYFGVENVNPLDRTFNEPRGQSPTPNPLAVNNSKINEILRANGRYFSQGKSKKITKFNKGLKQLKKNLFSKPVESLANNDIIDKISEKYETEKKNSKYKTKAKIILGVYKKPDKKDEK